MRYLFISVLFISTLISCGSQKELSPEKQAEVNAKQEHFQNLFESKSFVLEANTLFGKRGQSFPLSSNINFVLLEDGEGTLQLSFNNLVGWNGVGGITLEGKVRNYEIIPGKNNSMPGVKFDMSGTFGWATVNISTNSSGNARATIDGGYRGDRIIFSGALLKLEESRIYKGTSRF